VVDLVMVMNPTRHLIFQIVRRGSSPEALKRRNTMTKTKKKREHFINRGPLPSDDPIYNRGRVMLRPIRGRKQAPAPDEIGINMDISDPEDSDSDS
jgi:hypothetical protein